VGGGYVGKNIQVALCNVIEKRGMKARLSFLHFSVVLMEAFDRVGWSFEICRGDGS